MRLDKVFSMIADAGKRFCRCSDEGSIVPARIRARTTTVTCFTSVLVALIEELCGRIQKPRYRTAATELRPKEKLGRQPDG